DGKDESQKRRGKNRSGRQTDSSREQRDRNYDFEDQDECVQQVLREQDVTEADWSRVVVANAFALVRKAVVCRRHQHEDEIAHHAGKEGVRRDSRVTDGWMFACELRTEQK